MVEAGTGSLPTKVHQEKKPQSKKPRRCLIGNLIPYQTPSSFFVLRFFFLVNFCEQTAASEFNQGHSTCKSECKTCGSADLENESDRVSPVYGRWFRPELVSANLWGNFAALVFCSSARETRFIVFK
jgi:hypothetical protein